MKTLLIAFLLSINVVLAEPTAETLVEEAGQAIATIKRNSKANDVLLRTKPRPAGFQAKWKALYDKRTVCYAKMRALQAKLKINNSIFDYPGLLALGEINYSSKDVGQEYALIIHDGYSDCSDGSSETRFYIIRFNNKGRIISKGRAPRMLE